MAIFRALFWTLAGILTLILAPLLLWVGGVAWLALTGQSFN